MGGVLRREFKVDADQDRISVLLEEDQITQAVVFYRKKDGIEVFENGKAKFKATPTISDDGECSLKVNGQERDIWQVRKLALEDFLFSHFD